MCLYDPHQHWGGERERERERERGRGRGEREREGGEREGGREINNAEKSKCVCKRKGERVGMIQSDRERQRETERGSKTTILTCSE